MSGVLLDDAVADGESEPGALAHTFRRVERIVNLGDVLRRDADARVGDLDYQRAVLGSARRAGDASTVGNRIARVEYQVSEHLLKFAGVAVNVGRVFVVGANDLDLAATELRFE